MSCSSKIFNTNNLFSLLDRKLVEGKKKNAQIKIYSFHHPIPLLNLEKLQLTFDLPKFMTHVSEEKSHY